jgi:hypothetical protein
MRGEQLFQLRNCLGTLAGEVFGFAGVIDVIVKFEDGGVGCGSGLFPLDEAVAVGADGAPEKISPREDMNGVVAMGGRRIL